MSAPISSPWHLVLQDFQWCPCPQAVPWPEMWWEIDANTSRVFCLASLISSHWHQQIFHFPGYISLRKVTQTQQPASFLAPGRYGLLSYTRIIYYVLTDQGGKLSCTWESFLLILNSYFLPLRTLQVPWGVRVEPMPTQVKSTHPHWIYLFVCLVCLGVVLYVFGRQ